MARQLFRLLVLALAVLAAPSGPAVAQTEQASCQFALGFMALHDLIPQVVGDCLENEWHNPDNGDGLQRTTGGLLVWRKADNWTAFTDGTTTWINGPQGLASRPNTGPLFPWEAPAPAAESGIAGLVLIGPTCPVVRLGADCDDRPYQATITVLDQRGQVVTRFQSGPDGRFRVPLSPGAYTLRPESPSPGRLPFGKEQVVTVTAGQFAEVRITYDSGIR